MIRMIRIFHHMIYTYTDGCRANAMLMPFVGCGAVQRAVIQRVIMQIGNGNICTFTLFDERNII